MPHDVFISHCGKDKAFADAACAKMEQKGIRCWMVPRDVPRGEKWPKAIAEAIQECQVMVLVFSSTALATESVESEITLAGDCKKVIIPVRIEKVDPTGGFKFLLARVHWLDAMTEPVDKHLEELADVVARLLERIRSGSADEPVAGAYEPPPRVRRAAVENVPEAPKHAYQKPIETNIETNAEPRFDTKPKFDAEAKVPRLASTAIILVAVAALILIVAYLYMMTVDYSSDSTTAGQSAQWETGSERAAQAKNIYGSLKRQLVPKYFPTPAASSNTPAPPAQASSAAQPSLAGNKAQATITLTSNPNPAIVGQSVTLTAALSGGVNTNGETVSFFSYNGARLLGTGQLSNGAASFNTTPATEFTGAGTRDLTASYGGDSATAACTSPVYVQTLLRR